MLMSKKLRGLMNGYLSGTSINKCKEILKTKLNLNYIYAVNLFISNFSMFYMVVAIFYKMMTMVNVQHQELLTGFNFIFFSGCSRNVQCNLYQSYRSLISHQPLCQIINIFAKEYRNKKNGNQFNVVKMQFRSNYVMV